MIPLAGLTAFSLFLGATGSGPAGFPTLARRDVTAEVSAVADRSFLTEAGRDLLDRTGAIGASPTDLERVCGEDEDEGVIASGCYSPAGILVFIPADSRVADRAVTTLAHELLHAAFDDLGRGEIGHVRDLLHEAIGRIPDDAPVREQIDWSVGSHEENRDTELFAYLGSQEPPERGFPPELEAVWSRYVSDRAALVEVDRRVQSDLERLTADYNAAAQAVADGEMDGASARSRVESDRARHDQDRQAYQAQADRYNATDPARRAQMSVTWVRADGTEVSGPWGDALDAEWNDLEARRADLDARATELTASETRDAEARAALDAQYADVLAVWAASDPNEGHR